MRWLLPALVFVSSPAFAQLKADFAVSKVQGCTPLNVQFTDKSTGSPSEWFWNFGNGSTSALQNPSVIYATSGTYTVRLIVKKASQQDYIERVNYITVFATPQTGFTVSIDSGCVPLQVSFTDTTSVSKNSIKNWSWDFGDGNISGQQNPNHTYISEGRFNVSLSIQTMQGCSSSFQKNPAVSAGIKPKADFKVSPLNGCASLLRQFTNASTGKLTSLLWNFGDGNMGDKDDPLYHFQDTGWLSVKLVATRYGCSDSILKPNYVHVTGPVARMIKDVHCDDRFTLGFKDVSIGGTSRAWDFGDGTTSALKGVVHVFASQGQYTVKLKVTENACSDVITQPVIINTTKPVINAFPQKNLYCRDDSIMFVFSKFDSTTANSFAWDFNNGDTIGYKLRNDTATYVYQGNGKFKPVGFYKDINRCIDTVPLNTIIRVIGPDADFQTSLTGCTKTDVTFKDKSNPDQTPVNQWFWDYGDGTAAVNAAPFTYQYTFPGIYNIKLKITDGDGCTDTVSHPVEIFQTPVVDAGRDTFLCSGNAMLLIGAGADQYKWETNGTTICNNCNYPVVFPATAADYIVTGNSNGCTAKDTINVTVQSREKVSVQPTTVFACDNDSVQLHATGTDFYSWFPNATLDNINIPDPFAYPFSNSVYTVVGRDSSNCFSDTASVTVTITHAPFVNIPNRVVQLPAGSDYNLQAAVGADVKIWQWLPQTGLSCYNCSNPVASVNNNITYVLKVANSAGCSSTDTITILSMCNGEIIFVPNTFSPNNDGMNDYFFPNSKANVTIKSFRVYNRWGQQVFEKNNFQANDYTKGWNGKYNNVDQKEDVYVYLMEVVCSNGKLALRKGNVTLIR